MAGDPGIRQAMRRVQYAMLQRKNDNSEPAKHKLRWMVECLADELRLSLENTWGAFPTAARTATGEQRAELPEGCGQGQDGEPPLPPIVRRPR
jgi:hypothetical protein